MRRVLFVWLPASVIVVASVVGIGWGAYWWWQNQPEQQHAAATAAYAQAEAAREAGDAATAIIAYVRAEEHFVNYLRDGPRPPSRDVLVLRYRTLSQAATLLATEEAARAAAPGRNPSTILGVARQCAAQAAEDESNVEAQAAMLECCFREDQLDLAERYARNFLKGLTAEQQNDPTNHAHVMGAHYVLARSALRRTPPQADDALEHLAASDSLQKDWIRQQYGDSPVLPSIRYRWRLTHLEAQALAVQAAPSRIVAGSRAVNNARTAAQELQARIAVWLQRIRDEVSAAGDEPSIGLAKLTASDLRGLLDFMTFAVEHSGTRGAAVERVELMLSAWNALLAGREPSRLVRDQLVERLGGLPRFLEGLPPDVRPASRDWAGFYPKWETVASRLLVTGAEVQPASYLELTRSAHKHGHYEQGTAIARAGIRAAETRRLAADHRDVLELHGEVAWMSLLRGKLTGADEHLTALRRQTKHLRGLTIYVESLADLDAGQLDAATAKLQQVRQLPEYSRSLYPHLGLARALADAGRFDQALSNLDRLDRHYQRYENLPEEQQIVARRLGLHRAGVNRELFRTYLALGDTEKAAEYKELLREDPDWLGVSVMLASHLLGLAPTSPRSGARTPGALDAAKAELAVARRFAPEDPRLLLLEAELIAAHGGVASHSQAEQLLREALAGQEDRPETHLVRIVWLLRHGRHDDVGSSLAALEKSASALEQERLPALRARWQLARPAWAREAERLLAEAGVIRERGFADLHLAFADGRTVLSKSEIAGLRFYQQALTHHARGNLESAARGYLRALPFGAFRPEARRHLLACLLQIRSQDSPAAANALAVEMLQSRPNEPALMLAFIETAVLLDNIHGSQGVEGALEGLETFLRDEYGDAVHGPCFQARTWLLAGRPDRAVRSIERALQVDPTHLPSLRIAVEATRAVRDWPTCFRHAQSLLKAEPGSFDGLLARAEAQAGQGDEVRALQAYQELLDRYPDRPEGCLGPAALLEQSGSHAEALTWFQKRRERAPADLTALQGEVRVRARLGQLPEEDTVLASEYPVSGAEATLAISRGLLEAGEPERALAWARRAEVEAKDGPTERLARARCGMGDACRALAEQALSDEEGKKQRTAALRYYQDAYRDVPGLSEAGKPLALLLVAKGEADAAFAIVQRLRQGRYNSAAVSGDRLPLDLLDVLGVVYRATAHHRETVTLFREATFRYADEPVVHLHLGRALAALKRKPEATEALDRAAQLAAVRADRARSDDDKTHWLRLADEAQQIR